MGAIVALEDEIKTCTKQDLKPGSDDIAKTGFQLLTVVNILALVRFVKNLIRGFVFHTIQKIRMFGMSFDITYLLELCDL